MSLAGRVVAAHGRHVIVESDDGRRVHCHLRGKKTDAVVGDRVRWSPTGDEGVLEAVLPRSNLFFRQDEWRTKSFAANLDLVLVLVAGEPMFGEESLTRALIAAQHVDVPALVVLNKADLPAVDAARTKLQPYVRMGVPLAEVSMRTAPEAARATLLPHLAGRTTLVLGPSGMGKSTLINLMVPQAAAQVGEISQALGAGRHTTTHTAWFWMDEERRSALIDSPGFQAFGLHHVPPEQLAACMPDLAPGLGHCRFHNCTHRQEPGCAVRERVARGEVSENRYRLYLALHDELSQPPRY